MLKTRLSVLWVQLKVFQHIRNSFCIRFQWWLSNLGHQHFFLTFSCAALQWNELISIIFKLNDIDIADEDIDRLSYHERCDTFNKNPVLVAIHFQYRVKIFFSNLLFLMVHLGRLNMTQFEQNFKLEEAHIYIHLSGFWMHLN